MKLLLDTHALLWWWTDDPQLGATARAAIAAPANEVWVSAASAWEIATKQRLGKLGLPEAVTRFNELIAADGFKLLAISAAHALRAGTHPAEHRDPFDRMLAAQAELEAATLLTRDPALQAFGCPILW
jgi:PIN domain nuclease of toxin-antitoxin system